MIEAHRLTKRYGLLTALDSVSLTIGRGETFGLLGPNGAGKTTALRLMAGLAEPSEGSVQVGGCNPWKEPDSVRQMMGVLLDGGGLFDRLTVSENLRLFAGLFQVPKGNVIQALDRTGIADLSAKQAGKLSKGQRQRVALSRALIHNPVVLFLDEPTAGLDPSARASFHDALRELSHQGVTIVICSHDMDEVNLLCDRVGILDRGRLVGCGTPVELKSAYGRRRLIATVQSDHGPRRLEWDMDDATADEQLAAFRAQGKLLAMQTQEPTLADVFIHLTGRELR